MPTASLRAIATLVCTTVGTTVASAYIPAIATPWPSALVQSPTHPTALAQTALAQTALAQTALAQTALAQTPPGQTPQTNIPPSVPAQPGLEMRVALDENIPQVQIGASTTAIIKDANGRAIGQLQAQSGDTAQLSGGQIQLTSSRWQGRQLWIEPTAGGYVWVGTPAPPVKPTPKPSPTGLRPGSSAIAAQPPTQPPAQPQGAYYRGRVLLVPTAKGITVVNYVGLEEYLYSVVASEMPSSWSLEALKAQAVAARSYALARRDRFANPLYDLGDTVAAQVYKGVGRETTNSQTAVNATTGQVLSHNGRIIEAVFHSSSGGATENSEDVWSAAVPYLRGVQDFDQGPFNPHSSWTQTLSSDDLQAKLTTQIPTLKSIGRIINLTPGKLSPRGRMTNLQIIGDKGSQTITGTQLRQALNLKSTLFTVTPSSQVIGALPKENSTPLQFNFEGRGFGHGLGMSQYGAYGMAQKGSTYRQILGHYYQGATLSRMRVVR